MDLKDFGRAVIRRWDFAIAILLLSAGVAVSLTHLVSPQYTAVASAVLIPPQSTVSNAATTSVYAPPNPLLYLGGLTQSRDILLRTLGAAEVSDLVSEKFPTATYDAASDPTSSGPLIIITVRGTNDSETLAVMKMLSDRIPVALADIQQKLGIAQNNRISSLVLTQDEKSLVVRKSQLEASVLGGAGTALFGFLLLGLWDNIVSSRRRVKSMDNNGRSGSKRSVVTASSPPPDPAPENPAIDYPRRQEHRSEAASAPSSAPEPTADSRAVYSGSGRVPK